LKSKPHAKIAKIAKDAKKKFFLRSSRPWRSLREVLTIHLKTKAPPPTWGDGVAIPPKFSRPKPALIVGR